MNMRNFGITIRRTNESRKATHIIVGFRLRGFQDIDHGGKVSDGFVLIPPKSTPPVMTGVFTSTAL